MIKKVLILLFMISGSFYSHAEYRVYQYVIKNKIVSAQDQSNSHVVISTLNPVSYVAYNGGSSLVSIDLLRTWMCPGDTSYRKNICNSPYGKLPEEVL